MVWEALHIDRAIDRETLASGVAGALGIAIGDMSVAVGEDTAKDGARVLVASRNRPGDFLTTVDIITGDEALEEKIGHDSLLAMCVGWSCRGLVDDGGVNPYRMILLNDGDNRPVYIEPKPFDDRDELIIVGPASSLKVPKIPEAPRSQRRPSMPPRKNADGDDG